MSIASSKRQIYYYNYIEVASGATIFIVIMTEVEVPY